MTTFDTFMDTVQHAPLYATFDKFELAMTLRQVESVPQIGAADAAVAILALNGSLIEQLDTIGPDKLRDELRQWGAWDETELADDHANRERIIWIAACNIREEK